MTVRQSRIYIENLFQRLKITLNLYYGLLLSVVPKFLTPQTLSVNCASAGNIVCKSKIKASGRVKQAFKYWEIGRRRKLHRVYQKKLKINQIKCI